MHQRVMHTRPSHAHFKLWQKKYDFKPRAALPILEKRTLGSARDPSGAFIKIVSLFKHARSPRTACTTNPPGVGQRCPSTPVATVRPSMREFAIRRDYRPGDHPRLVRGQEQCDSGDVFRLTDRKWIASKLPLDRLCLRRSRIRIVCVAEALEHSVSFHQSRANRVGPKSHSSRTGQPASASTR